MKHIMGINPGETYFAASDIGWVVGHTYICYAPLICGGTGVLFEGKPGIYIFSNYHLIIYLNNI